MATMSMNTKIIKFLRFKAKFDFSERDRWGNTPYENAIEIRSKKIKIQILNEEAINEIIEILATIGNEWCIIAIFIYKKINHQLGGGIPLFFFTLNSGINVATYLLYVISSKITSNSISVAFPLFIGVIWTSFLIPDILPLSKSHFNL